MTRLLMVGYSRGHLAGLDDVLPARSVVVIEEPDIIRKRSVLEATGRLACVSEVVPAAYHQASEFLEAGLAIHERRGVDAVMPGIEYAVEAAAALAARLGLPGASEGAARTLRDKLRLREVTSQAGVRNPQWREVKGPQDLVSFAGDDPVVLKPTDRQASLGVRVLDRLLAEQAPDLWRTMVGADEAEHVPDRLLRRRFLAERRLDGPEYSVEALVRRGELVFRNVTEKELIGGPLPIELGHVVPAPLHTATADAFDEAMRALVHATGFSSGILHAEWILTADGPALIECAGRCPGDRIVDLIDLAYGTHLRLGLVELLSDRSPDLQRHPRRAAAIRFLSGSPGRVTAVEGVERLGEDADVEEIRVTVAPGDELHEWRSSWDRPGYVIVTAPDGDAARARAMEAADAISITTA